jgi:hypothetical protein
MAKTSIFAGVKLFAVGDANPRRKGSVGFKSHAIIRKNPGITYEAYVEKGGIPASLRFDYAMGYVTNRAPRAKAKTAKAAKAQTEASATK